MTLPEMIKMTIKPSPFSIRAASSAIVLALGLTAAPAGAADLTLDLPEQALSRSLNTIAQQGQIQLLYDAGQLGALRAPALHGSYSAQTAIRTLLAGSGLTLVQQGSSYVIRPLTTEAETILIPETRVQGELAYHPATDVMSAPQYITAEEIRQRNTGDGNVTELLRTNPAVQFAGNDSSSLNQGEIKPSRISIHGASSFQNAYKLDGISFNNDFDPAKDTLGETSTRLDSGDQGMYIDSRLIDSVTVYDNNTPVEFGGFTGGSVDVTSRRWNGENSGHMYYRTTRSSWNHLFEDSSQPIDSSKNDISHPARFQNEYNKHDFGGWFEVGVTENSGLTVSASRRTSTIPANTSVLMAVMEGEELVGYEFDKRKRNQKRTSDNLFVKYAMDLSPVTTADISLNYSDYKARLFASNIANSGYDNNHKGLGVTGVLKHQTSLADLEFTLGYQKLKDNRVNDEQNFYEMKNRSPDGKTIVNTKMGGLGDLRTEQDNVTTKAVARFLPSEGFGITHRPTLGMESTHTKGRYIRDKSHYHTSEDYVSYAEWGFEDPVVNKHRFLPGTASVSYNNYSLFADDNIEIGRLTLRPGVRVDRDDFVRQTNIAPRLAATYDLFGNKETLLIAGANRYYGRSMLTYALYGAQNAGLEKCYMCGFMGMDPTWDKTNDYEGLDSLKTPYNDEISLGLQQEILSTTWRLTYVHREGYDEVRSRTKYNNLTGSDKYSDKGKIRTFDNAGRSKHDSVTLAVSNSQPWEWGQATHVFTSSIVWQDTKTNFPSDQGYAFFEPGTAINSDKVMYGGKVIDVSDLPASNFNSPLKLNVELTSDWDNYNISWYNRLQWWGARNQAVRHDNEVVRDPQYGELRVYQKEHFASKFTWDTRVNWKPEFAYGASVSLEVNNVLNNKNVADTFIYAGNKVIAYDPGRQFWLQLNYDF